MAIIFYESNRFFYFQGILALSLRKIIFMLVNLHYPLQSSIFMQKIVPALFLGLFITSLAQAQIEKGKTTVGGSVSFSTYHVNDTDVKSTSFSIGPSLGWFISDKIELGGQIGYNYDQSRSVSSWGVTETKLHGFQLAPYGRLFFGEGQTLRFFGSLSIPFSYGRESLDDFDSYSSITSIGARIAPGIVYFPSEKVGIEFTVNGLQYRHTVNGSSYSDLTSTANAVTLDASSLAPILGIRFYL